MANIQLFEALKQDLISEEIAFGMEDVLSLPSDEGTPETFGEAISCGAVCCLVALTLSHDETLRDEPIERYGDDYGYVDQGWNSLVFSELGPIERAQEMLGLKVNEAVALFSLDEWPREFYEIAITDGERAGAIKLIERIIADGSASVLVDQATQSE